jgi:hypothetical protein
MDPVEPALDEQFYFFFFEVFHRGSPRPGSAGKNARDPSQNTTSINFITLRQRRAILKPGVAIHPGLRSLISSIRGWYAFR